MAGTQLGTQRVAAPAELGLRRQGIRFWNVAPDLVRIEVELENHGGTKSEPTTIHLQAAPFGAFVPWKPLTDVAVPSIEPGAKVVVSTEAKVRRESPIGDLSALVPRQVLTANGNEPPRRLVSRLLPRAIRRAIGLGVGRRDELAAAGELLAQDEAMGRVMSNIMTRTGSEELPPDLNQLLGRECPHWAGNIDVLVGLNAVERHMAKALRVYPGRANVALFMLGGGARRYSMRIAGDVEDFGHALYDPLGGTSLHEKNGTYLLDLSSKRPWARMILYVCRPPEGYERGSVEVHVQRQPGGDQAVVEFSLAADALGTGCYAV